MIKIIAILLCSVALISAISTCCNEENILMQDRNCSDGRSPKKLNCKQRIIVEAISDEAIIDEKGTLIFDGEDGIPPDEYCFTTLEENNNSVYLVCIDEQIEAQHREEYITMINITLSFISVVFIIITIAVYLSIPQLLDLQGICLVQSISGLAFSFIILGIINLSYMMSHECHIFASLMYLSFIYAFFWLNILSFHIWRVIVRPKVLKFVKHWLFIYHIFGIGGPLILLAIVLVANYSGLDYFKYIHPGIGEGKCWFKTSSVTFIYFYGPISVLLGINIIYFIWTIIVLWGEIKKCSEKKAKVLKYRLLLCIKLFFVMGITWSFEVISAFLENETSKWVWIIPDSLNALQGFLIFLILVVFRKRVLRELANKKLFRAVRLPASWKHAQDDECEELEEEISLSGVQEKKADIIS